MTDNGRRVRMSGSCGAGLAPLWIIGWLFTIGFLGIPFFWKGVLALIIWPYYLGVFFR